MKLHRLLIVSAVAAVVQLAPARAGLFGPVFPAPWNSTSNKAKLEKAIKQNWKLQLTGAPLSVASATCKATSKANIWNCNIRYLGNPGSINYRIEVEPDSGRIAGQPVQ